MCGVSIPAIVLMIFYFTGNQANAEDFPLLAKFSLGSLSGAQTLCLNQFYGITGKSHDIECKNNCVLTELTYFGAISDKNDNVAKLMKEIPYHTSPETREFYYNYCGNPDNL